jgi:hypothetical protein
MTCHSRFSSSLHRKGTRKILANPIKMNVNCVRQRAISTESGLMLIESTATARADAASHRRRAVFAETVDSPGAVACQGESNAMT